MQFPSESEKRLKRVKKKVDILIDFNKTDEAKLTKESQKFQYQCKCGKKTVIYSMEKKTKKVCSWCGNYVYISPEEEFKDKLRKALKEVS